MKLGSTHGRPIVSMYTLSGEVPPHEPATGQCEVVDQVCVMICVYTCMCVVVVCELVLLIDDMLLFVNPSVMKFSEQLRINFNCGVCIS